MGTAQSQTLSNLGAGAPMATPAGSPFTAQSNLAPTIVSTVSPGASLTYEIDVSNDGVNWNVATAAIGVVDGNVTPASGLTGNINFGLVAWTTYWRINVTSYTSGSVSAAYAYPQTRG